MNEEMFEEGEAMASTEPTAVARFTGSTGTNPLSDGTFRAMLVALPAGVLAFVHIEFGFLGAEGFAALEAVVAPVGVLLWAAFDKFVKPRLSS